MSPLGLLHACSQGAPKVTSATETATTKAVATATPALATSVGQLERKVEQTLQERSGLSQSTLKDYQGAIAQGNGITGVRSSVYPSVAPQALQPIPPTTHTLLSAEHFIDPNGFSAAGIAFSANGKALLQQYFSCEGPAGKELHFKVKYQYPDGSYTNGDVNMSSFPDCPLQIKAISDQMKQGGFATVYAPNSALKTIITPKVDAASNILQLEFSQIANEIAPQSIAPSHSIPTNVPTPMPIATPDRFRRVDR